MAEFERKLLIDTNERVLTAKRSKLAALFQAIDKGRDSFSSKN